MSSPPVDAVLQAARKSLLPFRRTIPSEVREELCQETVLRVLDASQVRHPSAFAWQVARRLAIDHVRRGQRQEAFPEPVDGTFADRVERALDAKRVMRRVLHLAPSHGRFLAEHYLGERDVDELVGETAHRGRARDALYKRRSRALRCARDLFPELLEAS
ncbi:MAG: sigma-70 family RNA polymerase sigma factor [Alphaproteobacteria bacterium]|nr:sigma-70 family RNA polymerase sigma factor [Alphaproteobacteria bacterium]